MSISEVMTVIEQLSLAERIAIMEETLRLIRQDMASNKPKKGVVEKKQSLADAAALLLSDYRTDKELTAFSALDSEDFYAA